MQFILLKILKLSFDWWFEPSNFIDFRYLDIIYEQFQFHSYPTVQFNNLKTRSTIYMVISNNRDKFLQNEQVKHLYVDSF